MFTNCELFIQSITDYSILLLNSEGIIQSCNTATYEVTGFTNDELVNRPFAVLYTGDDKKRRRSEDELSTALDHGKVSSDSWKCRKDGTIYWASMTLNPVFDAAQQHVGFTAVLRNINERKLASIELKEIAERYRLMVDGIKDYCVYMLDAKGYVLTWNEGGKKIKGYSPNEVIGRHFSLFYPIQDIESGKPQKDLDVAIKAGKYEEEGWRLRKNGSLFWANIVITPLYNEHNRFVGFSKVTQDLSNRKNEEELIKQSEERYRLLVEQVKDYGIFMLDEKGRIISWNEGAKRIKGYEPSEILGKYFSIFYSEEDKLNERPAHELKVARECGKYEEEGWRIRKDGSLFWANVVITAINNSQGVFLGFSKVTRDLTERKEAELVLKESRAKYKLLAKQLKDTNTNLEKVNHELREFTSIVSHDLQEPVRTIKSFLVLIEKKLSEADRDPVALRTFIQKAVKANDRMKVLISNLLDYAQLGYKEVVFEEIDVNEMIGEVLQNLKAIIESTGAVIKINLEVQQVNGDKVQLMQVIQNLITNSLKFVHHKVPNIEIACRKENERVLFSVSDNGIGIAKDGQARIFEIFRREHEAKEYPGTGIGLSICKKIVDRHNGTIWPESESGKGATFFFTLHDNQVDLKK